MSLQLSRSQSSTHLAMLVDWVSLLSLYIHSPNETVHRQRLFILPILKNGSLDLALSLMSEAACKHITSKASRATSHHYLVGEVGLSLFTLLLALLLTLSTRQVKT